MNSRQKKQIRRRHSTRALSSAALLCVVPMVSPIAAANWDVAPAVRLQSGHNSNLRLTSENKDSAWSNTLSVDAQISNTTPRSEFRASVGVGYNNYLNASDQTKDRFTQQVAMAFRSSGPNVSWQFTGTANQQDLVRTVRFVETAVDPINNAVLDDIVPPEDSIDDNLDQDGPVEDNVVSSQISRVLVRAAPSVQIKLSRRDRLRLGLLYSSRGYKNDNNLLQDNKNYGAQLEYARDIDERNIFLLTGGFSYFDPDRNVNSRIHSAGLAWRTQLSETFRVEANVGLVHVDSKLDSNLGGQFGIRARARLQNTSLSARVGRGFQPNAFGNVARTDVADLVINRSLSNKLSGGLRARYQARRRTVDTAQVGNDLISDRDRVSAGTFINYRLAPQWTVGSSYEYRWIKRDDEDRLNGNSSSANGHALFATLTYRPATTGAF